MQTQVPILLCLLVLLFASCQQKQSAPPLSPEEKGDALVSDTIRAEDLAGRADSMAIHGQFDTSTTSTASYARTDTTTSSLASVKKDSLAPAQKLDYDTSQWLELTLAEHGIWMDLRYATANNFMEQQIYDCGRCFYRKKVARALIRVHEELATIGLGLKMFDCYRPAPYQQRLWDILPDARYVARPSKGSLHSRGAAADLTMVDLETGEEMDMGTHFDFFGREAYTTTTDLPEEVLYNRSVLQTAMKNHGFGTIRTEWWHFNYLGPRLPLAEWVWPCE